MVNEEFKQIFKNQTKSWMHGLEKCASKEDFIKWYQDEQPTMPVACQSFCEMAIHRLDFAEVKCELMESLQLRLEMLN